MKAVLISVSLGGTGVGGWLSLRNYADVAGTHEGAAFILDALAWIWICRCKTGMRVCTKQMTDICPWDSSTNIRRFGRGLLSGELNCKKECNTLDTSICHEV